MDRRISKTAIIYPGVELGDDVTIEDFCVIGAPYAGAGNAKTIIGSHSIVRSHTVIYAGNQIGSHFVTGNKANIRECNQIGSHVSVGTLAVVEHHVLIENGVRIHSQAFVPEYTILRELCWIGPNVVLTNAKYPQSIDVKATLKGPEIGRGAKLGAGAVILPGIHVAEMAIVGAGAVVTRNVSAGVIVVGNPAAEIKRVPGGLYLESSV